MALRIVPKVGDVIQSENAKYSVVITKISCQAYGHWMIDTFVKDGDSPITRGFMQNNFSPCCTIAIADTGEIINAAEDSYERDFVWIFDTNGRKLFFKKLPDTKIWSVAMSADGEFCCFETDISCNELYDKKLFIHSGKTGKLINSFSVADLLGGSGGDVVKIDCECVVFDQDGFLVRVSHDGVILNSQDYLAHRYKKALQNDYGYSLYYISAELPPSEAIEALQLAMRKKFDGLFLAKILRRIGEITEDAIRDYAVALGFYQEALRIDEKVGVKTRIARCQKRIQDANKQRKNVEA